MKTIILILISFSAYCQDIHIEKGVFWMDAKTSTEAINNIKLLKSIRKGKFWYYNLYVKMEDKVYFKPGTMITRKVFLIEGKKVTKIAI